MPLEVTGQAEWGAGMWRGRKAPANAVYDAVNMLVDDEGNLFRRGGSTYRSGAATSSDLQGLGVLASSAGPVVLTWRAGEFYALAGDDSTLTSLSNVAVPAPFVRGATGANESGGGWLAPMSGNDVVATNGTLAGGITITPATKVDYVAAVGPRVIYIDGTRVWFTDPGGSVPGPDSYHLLNSRGIGAEGIDADTLMVFTQDGITVIENMTLDPVDDAGNIQQQVRQMLGDVILWGDLGVARWKGAVVVPALDDVYLVGLDGSAQPVSGAIRPLYREYVAAGYRPGYAATYAGHLWLPVLNGTTVVDTLVCRLDREQVPWTRWAGHAACPGYARRVRAGKPGLVGFQAQRLLDLTSTLTPSAANASDADGTAHLCTIITRDYPTSATNHPGTVARLRLRHELEDDGVTGTAAPLVIAAVSSDQDGGSFSTLTQGGVEGGAIVPFGGPSNGSAYHFWAVGRRRERVRFRLRVFGAAGRFVLRSLELLVRQSGLR